MRAGGEIDENFLLVKISTYYYYTVHSVLSHVGCIYKCRIYECIITPAPRVSILYSLLMPVLVNQSLTFLLVMYVQL